MKLEEQQDRLIEEQIDLQEKIFEKLKILSETNYDSNTIKSKIDLLLKSWYQVDDELMKIYERLNNE